MHAYLVEKLCGLAARQVAHHLEEGQLQLLLPLRRQRRQPLLEYLDHHGGGAAYRIPGQQQRLAGVAALLQQAEGGEAPAGLVACTRRSAADQVKKAA